jgi:two-component system alkaline phosphatase synthesis response regulator PhoP
MARESVLVVDDERDILELVKYNLDKEGYQVTVVATGEDALAAARTKMPDIVILDLMLPGVDGLEVCGASRPTPRRAASPS